MTTPNPEAPQPVESQLSGDKSRNYGLDELKTVAVARSSGEIDRGGWVAIGEETVDGQEYVKVAMVTEPDAEGRIPVKSVKIEDHEALQAAVNAERVIAHLGRTVRTAESPDTAPEPFIEPENERTLTADELNRLRGEVAGEGTAKTVEAPDVVERLLSPTEQALINKYTSAIDAARQAEGWGGYKDGAAHRKNAQDIYDRLPQDVKERLRK